MSVFKQPDRLAWTYKFQFKGHTYKGNTQQLTREDAEKVERQEKERVRRRARGLADLRDAPRFAVWAGVYLEHKAHSRYKVQRPDAIEWLLRTLLKFWGAKPSKDADPEAPYHDLTLADPITDPRWLVEFETWLEQRQFSGSHRNHLRTQISGMYKVAALPEHRADTGIDPGVNPMLGVPRDRRVTRDVELTPAQVTDWIAHASYHVRLALAIAALAPKLRLGNVLALRWADLDADYTRLTVTAHKTEHRTGRPLVVMLSAQLAAILKDARKRSRSHFVVAYQGRRLQSIRDGVKAAAERAGIVYGRGAEGATFHTVRHAVATWLAEMDTLTEPMRAALLGHGDIATTQGYTHLRPVKERAPLEQLSAVLPVQALVAAPWRRWSEKRDQSGSSRAKSRTKPRGRAKSPKSDNRRKSLTGRGKRR